MRRPVVARLGFTPQWARPLEPPSTVTHLDPTAYTAFAQHAAAFAARYAGRVSQVVVWNEPNLSNEWGLRPVDAAAYASVLRAVYPAVKAAAPQMQVLAGALAPTLEAGGNSLSDLLYLEQLYAALAGARPYDAWAAHSYGATAAHDAAPAVGILNFRRVELLRAIMERNGDAALSVHITEAGWNDARGWANAVTPAQRITHTLGALAYARAHWPWCAGLAFWVFKLSAPANGYRDRFAFVQPDLTPLPIYDELRTALVVR